MITKKRSFFVFLSLFVSIAGILGLGTLSAYTGFQAERQAAKERWLVPPAAQSVAGVPVMAPDGADT